MADVKIVMDGRELSVGEGKTILEAAEEAGITIPTLCHRPDLTPEGNCRVCVVEVEGLAEACGVVPHTGYGRDGDQDVLPEGSGGAEDGAGTAA